MFQVEAIKIYRPVIRISLLPFSLHLVFNPLGILLRYPEAVARKCSIKSVLKHFAKFRGKQLCRSLFFYKIVGGLLQKRDCRTCVFLQNSYMFYKEYLWMADSGYEVFSSIFFLHIFQKHLELFEKDLFLQ